jgi:hypothetical protein
LGRKSFRRLVERFCVVILVVNERWHIIRRLTPKKHREY